MADGIDLQPLPLKDRKAKLARIGAAAEGWMALANHESQFTSPQP